MMNYEVLLNRGLIKPFDLKFHNVKIILTLKEVKRMASTAEEIAKKIEELPDTDKAMLVDMILAKLDQPDVELDKIWAEEAVRRWGGETCVRVVCNSCLNNRSVASQFR